MTQLNILNEPEIKENYMRSTLFTLVFSLLFVNSAFASDWLIGKWETAANKNGVISKLHFKDEKNVDSYGSNSKLADPAVYKIEGSEIIITFDLLGSKIPIPLIISEDKKELTLYSEDRKDFEIYRKVGESGARGLK